MKHIIIFCLFIISIGCYSQTNDSLTLLPFNELDGATVDQSCTQYSIDSSDVRISTCNSAQFSVDFKLIGKKGLFESNLGEIYFFKPHLVKAHSADLIIAEVGDETVWGGRVYKIVDEEIVFLGLLDVNPGSVESNDYVQLVNILDISEHEGKIVIKIIEVHHGYDLNGIAYNIEKGAFHYVIEGNNMSKIMNIMH